MTRFLANRLLQLIPVVFGITLIGFVLIRMIPGDPALVALGEKATAEQIEAERRRQGLDRPLPLQYLKYLWNLARGDLGRSHLQKRAVSRIVYEALGVTARLALGAMAVALALGLVAGLLSAARPRTMVDLVSTFGALIGISIPAFWLAMLLILLFSVHLGWFPISGYVPGQIRYLILPSVSLGLISTAVIARLTRSSLLEALGQDYIRTARAKGLGEPAVLARHALSGALVPVLTVLGTNTAGLLAGAILTETVFGLPGLGKVVVDAISARDSHVLMGCLLVTAAVFVLANLAVDLLYAVVDPRIRFATVNASPN